MGAAKNIFGALTGLVDKAKSGLKSSIRSADSSTIKTTSKTLGSSQKLVSGGQSVAKESATNFAKGVGSTAKVGGKVFGAGVILGGTTIVATKIYDFVGDTWAITQSQREYENQLKLMETETEVTKKAQDQNLKYMLEIQKLRSEGQDSSVLNGSGGVGSDLFPVGSKVAEDSGNKNILMYALLGVVVLGMGTYIYSKKMKGGKN